ENQREIRALREEHNRKWEENQRELRALREEQERRWEEQNRKWEENQREIRALREEHNRKWEENQREIRALREEQERKWEENQREIHAILKEIQGLHRKHDSTLGALGARWGLHTEQSFRNALKGILEDSFDVKVLNVTEYDEKGEVFGRPDQVELDVIITNGTLILCEIKSSISKSEMYTFERKVRYYEKRHQRKADRALVISPMVEQRAKELAEDLGIEVYSYAEDVDPSVFY
ncbi:MAG: PD-(D/E)XK nuclease family protein, partial [Anaerolineae bacterium]